MWYPVALMGAIVQCVSQSNIHTHTHTLFKQTTPGKYSNSGYLFSLWVNVRRHEGATERQTRRAVIKVWHKRSQNGNRLHHPPLQVFGVTHFFFPPPAGSVSQDAADRRASS